MINRVLRVFVEFDSQNCSPDSKREMFEFALCESDFYVPVLKEHIVIDYIDDKYLKMTLFGDEIKVLVNFPYRLSSNNCPHLITLLYTDTESCDEMYLPGYIIEIDEHRIFEDNYLKNERNDISYMEPITYNIFPLRIVDKNIYVKNIDVINNKIDILCGESRLEGEEKTLSPEIDIQFMDNSQGGNTEESFFHITSVVKIRLIKLGDN